MALRKSQIILPGDIFQYFSQVKSIRLALNNGPMPINILSVRKSGHLWVGFQSLTRRATSIRHARIVSKIVRRYTRKPHDKSHAKPHAIFLLHYRLLRPLLRSQGITESLHNCDPLSENPAHPAFCENRDKTGNLYIDM